MTTPHRDTTSSRLETLIAMSRLLDRIEASARPVGAEQYRAVVEKLKEALGSPVPAPALDVILTAHPAAAELYENLHYELSGLSRSPLQQAVAAELLAAEAIGRARRRSIGSVNSPSGREPPAAA